MELWVIQGSFFVHFNVVIFCQMSYTTNGVLGGNVAHILYEEGWVILLEQTVTIKGTKSGIILVLNPSISFEELSSSIADKFKEASSFLGKHNMGLLIRGRELSEEQTDHVVKLIEANSNLTISCVIHDSEALDKSFQRAMGLLPDIEPEPLYDEDDTPGDDANTFIYRGFNNRCGNQ